MTTSEERPDDRPDDTEGERVDDAPVEAPADEPDAGADHEADAEPHEATAAEPDATAAEPDDAAEVEDDDAADAEPDGAEQGTLDLDDAEPGTADAPEADEYPEQDEVALADDAAPAAAAPIVVRTDTSTVAGADRLGATPRGAHDAHEAEGGGPQPARASIISRATLVVAVLAVVGALYVDAGITPTDPTVELAAEGTPTAGSAACAALSVEGGGDVVVTSALGPGTDDEVDAGDDPADVGEEAGDAETADADDGGTVGEDGSRVSLELVDAASRSRLEAPSGPGRVADATVTPGEQAIVAARWEGVPLALGRRVTAPEGARVPGAIEGPCPAGARDRWFVPGVVTAGGASATLHLANPTGASASLRIVFTTPDERIEPTRLGNVVVPAGERRVVDLNEFAPERPDLGVEVVARNGRVVVEAVQQLEAAVGDVDGRALVPAEPAPAEVWTVPWVDGAEGSSSWLWVTNPGDAPTEIRITVHGSDGPFVPAGAGTTLAPGRTQRIDLRGALDGRAGGVTVRSSEGAPVVVAAAVLRSGGAAPADDEATDEETAEGEASEEGEGGDSAADRGGIAVVTAAEQLPTRSVALFEGSEGTTRTLWLANPGEEAATVAVSAVGASGTTPLDAQVVVAPGAATSVELPLETVGPVAVTLDVVEGAVAATLVSTSASGPLELTALPFHPFVDDTVTVLRDVRRDRSLLHPIELGGDTAADPSDQGEGVPAPTPSVPAPSAPAATEPEASEPDASASAVPSVDPTAGDG